MMRWSPFAADAQGRCPWRIVCMQVAATLLMLGVGSAALACTVVASPLAFGAIDPLSPYPTDSASSLQVTCDDVTDYSVSITAGGGTFQQRQMSAGSHLLAYQLYTDASRSSVWGDGSHGTLMVHGSAGPSGDVRHVHGRVPAQAYAVPAAYGDILVITVSF